MLEEVLVNVWLEERLVSIWTVDSSNGNVICGIRKKLWKTVLCTFKSIVNQSINQKLYLSTVKSTVI